MSADAPGSRSIASRMTIGATDMAPMAARGWGMSRGSGTTGARAEAASSASRPPPVTATSGDPRRTASAAAETVSSVLPLNDEAITSVDGPTNAGTS
jgi:hypothetical protein